MTVDGRQRNNNLLWRRLDGKLSLPPTISPFDLASSLYANGCIYILRRSCSEPLIVEFNVGSEKFRVISIPNYIIEDFRHPYVSQLIQIDGRLAVLALKICLDDHTIINNNASMKMCVLYDNPDDKKLTDISSATASTSSAGTVSNNSDHYYWIEETFMMPPFEWKPLKYKSILAVPGTDLFIIRSAGEAGSSFYFYDWRKKSFSKDAQFFMENRKTSSGDLVSFQTFIYKESILPVT